MTSPLPRRRNGKQQACEPCRKSKMACDHKLPFCERCKRRRIVSKCQYLAAPMTRVVPATNEELWELSPVSLMSSTSSAPSMSVEVITPSIETTSTVYHDSADTGPFSKSTGFYGPTSFSAVFLENQKTFQVDAHYLRCTSEPAQEKPVRPVIAAPREREVPNSSRTNLGVKVLRQFPNQATVNYLMQAADKYEEYALHRPSLKHYVASTGASYGKLLQQPRRTEDLRILAAKILKNGEAALETTTYYKDWVASHSGERLRWETLGLIFSILGISALSLPEQDSFFATQLPLTSNKRVFATEMKECALDCLKLSQHMDSINPLMVMLNYKIISIETMVKGDSSLVVWRGVGDVCQMATAVGLHLGVDPTAPVSFETEMRKRFWLRVFGSDKCTAAFVGRPPTLSHRYSHCPMPLDLSEEELMLEGDELRNAVAALDANGWNMKGNIHTVTIIRAHHFFETILSETLEISLGIPSPDSAQHIIALRQRLEDTYDSFPPMLKLSRIGDSRPKENIMWWRQINIRLAYLRNHFLLDRLSVKHNQLDTQILLNVAREMLELSVLIWLERDRFVERHKDYDWMLMCYGIPSSGVLALELLKQLKAPHGVHPRLPRSEVVQNLSVLVRFLDWVSPNAANYALCGRMCKMIKDILDRVLDHHATETLPAPEVFTNQVFQMDFGAFDTFDNNMDWLDTMDWARGPWIDIA